MAIVIGYNRWHASLVAFNVLRCCVQKNNNVELSNALFGFLKILNARTIYPMLKPALTNRQAISENK